MNITIVTVGKLKEQYLKEACAEYEKRLSRFCKLKMIELPDESMSENPSQGQKETILKKEGQRILGAIKNTDMLITLCVEGTQLSSESFAEKLDKAATYGASDITFVIGGSLGLAEEIKQMSQLKLSFSKMTFPHQLMRVVLLEQIFRAFKINRNESYHK